MKKLSIITKMSFIFFVSALLSIVIWSCTDDDSDDLTIDGPELTSVSPDSGFVGDEVIIHGENFLTVAALNEISFNGTSATVIAADGISLTTTVPEGATTGELSVTTNGKTSNAISFNVLIPVIPTITSISPDNGDIGDEVIITGTDFSTTPEENIVSFNGGIATVISSTETTITAIVPATATTGDVTVTRDGESNGVLFTLTTPIYTLVIPLSDDLDDVEEGETNGAMAMTSSDLELGESDSWAALNDVPQGLQTIGIRFNDIAIPAGSTILNATIQFTCDNIGAEPVQMTIYGENIGNSPAFEEVLYNVTSRTKTSANAVWDIPEWVETGDAGEAQKTVDFSNIIQEIIAHADWASGNSLSIIMEPTIGVATSSGGREAEADVGDDAATLTIIYQ